MSYISQHATWGTELTIAGSTFTGSFQPLSGTFTHFPSLVIIQNDTNQTVALSADGVNTAISFVSGTKLVLDMQSDRGEADFFSFATGEQWYVSAAAGTGTFHIAYIYGKTPA
jgi:hypothetical protein